MYIVFSFFLSFFINPKQKNSKFALFLSPSLTLNNRVREPLCLSSSSSSRVDDDDVVFSRQRSLLKVVVVVKVVVFGTKASPSSDSMSLRGPKLFKNVHS